MNQMQQMLKQAQKMQKQLVKMQEELDEKEFTANKAGMVEVTVKGTKEIVSINIDADALDPDNKEMLEETILLAINETFEQIDAESAKIQQSVTGGLGGMGGGFPF